MRTFFYDSAEQELYVLGDGGETLRVLPRLKVRVIIGLTADEDERKSRGELTGGAARISNKRTGKHGMTCKNCGKQGHMAKTCPMVADDASDVHTDSDEIEV